jgi:AraC-like DNA-binding protein
MKILYKSTNHPLSGKISVRRENVPCFDSDLHFHDELELIYFIRGKGIRYVGDNVSYFSNGELALVGPNVPHLWRHDPGSSADMIIVHFCKDFIGKDFLNLYEASRIKTIIELSVNGMQIKGTTQKKAARHVCKLLEQEGMERIIRLVRILNILCQSKEYHLLSGSISNRESQESEYSRIKKVEHYISGNFADKITLKQVAEQAHMSPNAFCRYFKKHANRTLFEYIIEYRVRRASRLIIQSDRRISDIGMECGFKNMTLFNRQFKKLMKLTPKEYRYHYQAKESHCIMPLV